MTDWFAAHKRMLAAQREALDAGAALTRAQDAAIKAVEANVAAWQAWLRLWGTGPW